MTGPRRVVVTGVGLITPLGLSLEATVGALARGEGAAAPVSRFDASGFRQPNAAEVTGLDPRQHFTVPKAIKLTDQAARLGVAAARIALDTSGFPNTPAARETLGVLVGSSGADLQPADIARALAPDSDNRSVDDIAFFAGRILSGLNPLWLLVNLPNMISSHIAIQFGARGPNSSPMTDWVAGLQAVGEGFDWIRCGEAEAVLAGGADTGVLLFAYGAHEQAGLFDSAGAEASASTFLPGEGAAVFMLEERVAAVGRGAVVLGEITAYASASAPMPCSAGRRGGALSRTFRRALDAAGWAPGDVGRVGVAGHGLVRHTRLIQDAIDEVFGPRGQCLLEPDHTTVMGHALGAAGAIEAGLLLATQPAGSRMLCSAVGFSGQAVTLTLHAGPDGGGVS